jgi:hypothetical protein
LIYSSRNKEVKDAIKVTGKKFFRLDPNWKISSHLIVMCNHNLIIENTKLLSEIYPYQY